MRDPGRGEHLGPRVGRPAQGWCREGDHRSTLPVRSPRGIHRRYRRTVPGEEVSATAARHGRVLIAGAAPSGHLGLLADAHVDDLRGR